MLNRLWHAQFEFQIFSLHITFDSRIFWVSYLVTAADFQSLLSQLDSIPNDLEVLQFSENASKSGDVRRVRVVVGA